jgi:DNA-directed RNA polymerase subunit E'/Rpb7
VNLAPMSHNFALQVGFFAEAGPLQIFVSGHLIPEDFEYSQLDDPAFVSGDEEVRIQAGTEVRLRIVGTRTDASEIVRSPVFRTRYSTSFHA